MSGLLIPQKVFFQTRDDYEAWLETFPVVFHFLDVVGFTDIYLSPVTLFFLTLFFINLIIVTMERIPLLIRQSHIGEGGMPDFKGRDLGLSAAARDVTINSSDRAGVIKIAEKYFKTRGWYVLTDDSKSTILAVKNRFSVFGFLFFHLSFLLFLIGGLLIFYSRMSGNVVLTEGEIFTGELNQFRKVNRRPRIMEKMNIPGILLEDVDMHYKNNRRSDLFITLKIGTGEEARREIVAINQPAVVGNVTLLANNAGVSPLFILRDSDGKNDIDGAWISLNVLDGQIDSFAFSNSSTIIYRAWFYPDYEIKEGYESSRSPDIINPAFHISVEEKGVTVAESTIKKGQSMVFGQNMLVFADLRKWGSLQVVREIGPSLLVIGFALGITGLVMRLVFYRRELRIAVTSDRLYLVGKSNLYQFTFDEAVDDIFNDLKTKLKANS